MGLPEFVPPMLAKLGRKAFDSEQHLFEPKWDGFRALAFVEDGRYWVKSRRDRDFTPRYPEVEAVLGLAGDGLVLDGELIVLKDGRPDFESMLSREQARDARRVATLMQALPVTFVVFDLVWQAGESIADLPLHARRERLTELMEGNTDPRLVLSEGVVGAGRTLFREALDMGLEGVVAKRLDGPYLPGQRSDSWTKFKVRQHMHCIVLGFLRDESGDLKSLIVGADVGGELRCVGRVGSGLTESDRGHLLGLLEARPADEPLVDCGKHGEWVAPGLYCTVSFTEFTSTGTLRAPVFEQLVEE